MEKEVQTHKCRGGDTPKRGVDVLFRWGTTVRYPAKRTINKSGAISNASAKASARFALQKAGIAVPQTVYFHDLVGVQDMEYPVVVRPDYHRAGKHFYRCETPEEVAEAANELLAVVGGSPYVSALYPKTAEYRVHVGHGRVLLVSKKEAPAGQEHLYEEDVWNRAMNGFYFRTIRQNQWRVSVVRLGIQAVMTLGLDFGAADILYGAEGGPVVCEVNTAPTMHSYSASKYAAYFDWIIEGGGEREHLPLPPEDEVKKWPYVFKAERYE
jgi:D-alanine-D-alanine ligase-like ATP-grasp enzyme